VADLAPVYVRTDPNLAKHRGISIILVEYKKTPGITMRRLEMMSGLGAFNEVFYDNVKVPKENLLGEINGGWKIVMAALSHERSYGVMLLINIKRDIDLLIEYCKETKDVDGEPLSKNRMIRNRLADVVIQQEIARNVGFKLNHLALTGGNVVSTANCVKILGGITTQRVAQTGMQIMGLYGQLGPVGGNWRQMDPNDKWTRLGGRMKHLYLSTVCNTIAAGTTEVARNAAAGALGLAPESPSRRPRNRTKERGRRWIYHLLKSRRCCGRVLVTF
jgi:3-oxocholest-4-en-26-oyl-CoA dehydrogenase alpha subunit